MLEERTKEIEEFFKSDSEESENEDNKTNPLPSNDKETVQPKQDCQQQHISDATENDKLESEKIPLSLSNSDSQPIPQEMEEIVNDWNQEINISQEENENKITHQLPLQIDNQIEKESPLLLSEHSNDSWQDLSSVFTQKEKIENIKRLSVAKVSKPTLHGRPGQLLDLDVEPISTEQKNKVNSLIDRFVQQVTGTKKSPKKKDVQIRYIELLFNDTFKMFIP